MYYANENILFFFKHHHLFILNRQNHSFYIFIKIFPKLFYVSPKPTKPFIPHCPISFSNRTPVKTNRQRNAVSSKKHNKIFFGFHSDDGEKNRMMRYYVVGNFLSFFDKQLRKKARLLCLFTKRIFHYAHIRTPKATTNPLKSITFCDMNVMRIHSHPYDGVRCGAPAGSFSQQTYPVC